MSFISSYVDTFIKNDCAYLKLNKILSKNVT